LGPNSFTRLPTTTPSNTHFLCVHTRRKDFTSLGIESKEDFTYHSIEFIHRQLMNRSHGSLNITTVLIGDDRKWMLNMTKEISKSYHPTLTPRSSNRGEDMCFAIEHCNSLIITAPASTFGWWMGYLGRERASQKGADMVVYYNGDLERETAENTYTRDNFPPEWVPLKLVLPVNGTSIGTGVGFDWSEPGVVVWE